MHRASLALSLLTAVTLFASGQSSNDTTGKVERDKIRRAKIADERRLITIDLSDAEQKKLIEEIRHLDDELGSLNKHLGSVQANEYAIPHTLELPPSLMLSEIFSRSSNKGF